MCNKAVIVASLVTLAVLSGCSSLSVRSAQGPVALESGSIVIARPLPAIAPQPTTMLGFMPSLENRLGAWVSINRDSGEIVLRENDKELFSFVATEGLESLTPGVFTVVHKQRNPLWYAPDSYFSNRGLPLPAEGSKERFRRGALGEYALYLTPEVPIHSGPVWSEDVGGVRIDEETLSRLYYQLEVGVPVEITQ